MGRNQIEPHYCPLSSASLVARTRLQTLIYASGPKRLVQKQSFQADRKTEMGRLGQEAWVPEISS